MNKHIGKKFNKLTVKYIAGQRYNPITKEKSHKLFYCECECGGYTVTRIDHLRREQSTSCGCITNHGMSSSREYNTWKSMRQRCLNPKKHNYNNYGGRGIEIKSNWVDSFSKFYEDMGDRPLDHTLDRIDPNGHYEPDNCKWSTYSEQNTNKRKWTDSKVKLHNLLHRKVDKL